MAASLLMPAAPATAETLVGVAAPLSGRFAAQGDAIRRGIEQAAARINAANPARPDQPLRVVAMDDACEAKAAIDTAHRFIEQQVAVVIGHNCGSAAVAAAPVYAAANVLLLALTRHPELTDKRAGPTIYRIAGRDDRLGGALAGQILRSHAGKRVALVHDRTVYGRGLTDGVQKGLSARGAAPVVVDGIVAGNKDFAATIGKLLQARAEVIVFGGFPAEAGILLRQMRSAGIAAPMLGGEALAREEFLAAAGGDSEGTSVALPLSYERAGALAVTIWRRALERTGTQPLQSLDVQQPAATASGAHSPSEVFAANGDISGDVFEIHRWQDGRLVPSLATPVLPATAGAPDR